MRAEGLLSNPKALRDSMPVAVPLVLAKANT